MKKIFLILVLIFNGTVFSQPSLWPSQDGKILLEDSTLINLVDPVLYANSHNLGPVWHDGNGGFFVGCYYGGYPYPTYNAWTKYDKWGQKTVPWQLDLLFQFLIDDDGNIFGKNKPTGENPTHFRKLNSDLVPQWGYGVPYDFGYQTRTLHNKYSDGNGGFYAKMMYDDQTLQTAMQTFQHYYSDGTTQFPGMGRILNCTTDTTTVPLDTLPISFITQAQNKNVYLSTFGSATPSLQDTFAVAMMDTLGNFVWQDWLILISPSTMGTYQNLSSTTHAIISKTDENNNLHLIIHGWNFANFDSQKVQHFKVSPTGNLLEEHTFSNSVGAEYFSTHDYDSKVLKQISTSQGFIILRKDIINRLFHITHEGNIIFSANDSLGNEFQNPIDIVESVDSTFWVSNGYKMMRFDYNFNPVLSAAVDLQSGTPIGPGVYYSIPDGGGGVYNRVAKPGIYFDGYYVQHVSKNGLFDEVVSEKIPVNKPQTFDLLEIYPNPFNPTTKIVYETKSTGKLKITVYNTLGQKIRSWNLNKNKGEIVWNGTDTNGKQVASGVYLVNLVTKNNTTTKKITMLK